MKQCPYCGSELKDDAKFCGECGKAMPETAEVVEEPENGPADPIPEESVTAPTESVTAPAEPVAVPTEPAAPIVVVPEAPPAGPATPVEPASDMPVITQVPSKKQMLSTFQYVVLSLLYSLPVVGLVFLFIFGAGHPKNGSLKRFSAAMLILRLLFWIVLLALMIVAMVKNGRLLSDALGQLIPAVERLLEAIFA